LKFSTHKIKTYGIDNTSQKCLEQIAQFVQKQPYEISFKEAILNQEFIEINPNYYHSYPYLFAPAFSSIKEQLPKLNIAGFLIFKHVMATDRLLDEGKHNPEEYLIASAYKEEGIKILSRLFPENSQFWSLWEQRKKEYKKAYELDKSKKISSIKDYETLADYKSSFGKVAIDALHILSQNKNEQLYLDLLESHRLFSSGVQLVDDIMDIREDLQQGQFNMAYFTLHSELKKRGLKASLFSAEQIAKQLYIFDIAEELFEKSLNYYLEAEKTATKYNLNYWLSAIRERYNDALMKKLDAYAFKEHLKSTLELDKTGKERSTTPSVEKAVEYIISKQNKNGSWYDFYNGAGLSDTWATAFVLSNLLQQPTKNYMPKEVLKKGVDLITSQQTWGYNKYWIPDADSTTFALLSQFLNDESVNKTALKEWLSYQNSDGGFGTYNNPSNIISSLNSDAFIDVNGWINSHTCVSASAYYFLSKTGVNQVALQKIEKYLLEKVNTQGLWDAYWWTSPIYSTSFMIKSLSYCTNNLLKEKIISSMDALLQLQNNNGSFGDEFEKESPFYTSLVIEAFCQEMTIYKKSKNRIDKAVKWLLSEQKTNGSWQGTPIMRMPAPEIIRPKQISNWPVGTRGNNIRVIDFNRLFTTSIAVSALSNYKNIAG